ncbi:MAG: 3-deoxy-D-manno-octulosonic acid transferase [Acidobacteriota bacterium]
MILPTFSENYKDFQERHKVRLVEASGYRVYDGIIQERFQMFRTLLWVYSIFYTALLIFYLPVFLYRVIFQDKSFTGLLKRISIPALRISSDSKEPRLWIHAVSVGEVKAIQPLVDALSLNPDRLLISTITDTGQSLAQSLFRERFQVLYFPLDWKWTCRRYLQAIRPSAVLLTETEIWPGFISAAQSLNVPVLLINGRFSDRSFRRYRRIRFFLRPLLQRIAHFCMQSRQDKERILELGAAPSRVNQLGNLKYDYQLPKDLEKRQTLELVRKVMKFAAHDLLWVCGSTREGEEEILLEVFQALAREFPSLRLLLAPRHPHRAAGVSKLLEDRRLNYLKRSQLNSQTSTPPQVLLLDTIGELSYLYELADVVFVGGSLVATGGHNIIEAAYFGKPILFGPHMENFREISTAFLESYAALQAQSGEELISKIRDLLKDPAARKWLGRNARKVIRDNQGAVRRTVEIVREYLEK